MAQIFPPSLSLLFRPHVRSFLYFVRPFIRLPVVFGSNFVIKFKQSTYTTYLNLCHLNRSVQDLTPSRYVRNFMRQYNMLDLKKLKTLYKVVHNIM